MDFAVYNACQLFGAQCAWGYIIAVCTYNVHPYFSRKNLGKKVCNTQQNTAFPREAAPHPGSRHHTAGPQMRPHDHGAQHSPLPMEDVQHDYQPSHDEQHGDRQRDDQVDEVFVRRCGNTRG